jgi:hypothetical protein
MKKILFAALLAFSSLTFAANDVNTIANAGWNALSESEKAEIQKTVADKAAAKKEEKNGIVAAPPEATVKKVDEWVNLGERVGKMMGGAAKEVGIAVNEFAMSPVGLFTLGMILWKFMGGALVHIFGSFCILMVGGVVMGLIYRRMRGTTITYDKDKVNWFGNHPKLKVEKHPLSSDELWGLFLGSVLFTIVSMVVLFSY